MKVTVNQTGNGKDRVFPWIGISDGLIVLFSGNRCGVVLQSSASGWKVGEFDDIWNISEFAEFEGTITLEN